ncbi:MAG: PEP-CTERM sorting domain-containing protein, partial [Gemmatimonadaceae bacterium]
GNVSVKYYFSDAGNSSELRYKIGSFNALDPVSSYTLLFGNHPAPIAPFDQVNIGTVAPGQEVIFMLNNLTSGKRFYSGALARNPGGEFHVSLLNPASGLPSTYGGNYSIRFGFEDITPLSASDRDYNDIQFEIANLTQTVAPEPSAVALMAAGLMALGVAARRRRKV